MIIKLKIDSTRLTLNDLIYIEEGGQTFRETRDFLARFCVDDTEDYLPHDKAIKLIGALSLDELKAARQQFANELMALQEQLIPPESGGD